MGLVGGCTDDEGPTTSPPPRVEARQDLSAEALVALEKVVSDRDSEAAAALAPQGDDEAARQLADAVANARAVDVVDFTARYVDVDGVLTAELPDDQWSAAVDGSWAYRGFDRDPAHTEMTVTFEMDGDRAAIVGFGGGDRVTPLWLTDRLRVRRTDDSLVMVADGSARQLARYSLLARRAVTVVHRVLPAWRSGLVVEVPRSADELDAVLAATPGEYAAIAAVTATEDGSLAPAAPVHVFVNPEVMGGLRQVGAQVVMSHEATHAATRAVLTPRVPLWLLEGFADYVALRDVDLPLSRTAGQILTQVRRHGAPQVLPAGAEFDTRTTHLGASYEAAWLACRLLARIGGEDALVALYRRVSRGQELESGLRSTFGFGEKELTRRWREELTSLAG